MEYFIPFNTPSLKNGKIKTNSGIFHSKTVTSYLNKLGIKSYSSSKKVVVGFKTKPELLPIILKDFKYDKTPLVLGFHFVRDSKRRFDFVNICQVILDILVAYNYIEDDNMDYLIPMPYIKDNKWYSYDKENSGCYIKIIE